MMKIASVVGARPQFIKAAVLSQKLRKKANEVLIHTGQHYDTNLSTVFFRQLSIAQPDYQLHVGSNSHGKQTGHMLVELEEILLKERPNYVLVYGDTNSTLAGSLAAAKLHIPVIHVEAGLRSWNRKMPEEINRIMTDHLSTLLFCPTDTAVKNLAREGIVKGVYQVGDIMHDALLRFFPIATSRSTIHRRFNLQPRSYLLATIHRAENTDDPERLRAILEALASLQQTVILPLHPRTRKRIQQTGLQKYLQTKHMKVTEPLPYLDMLVLLSYCERVLTDSGGVQREAYLLKIPCVTLRDETEWPETVQSGWNQLAGTHVDRILQTVRKFHKPDDHPAIFGDGNATDKIVDIIVKQKETSSPH